MSFYVSHIAPLQRAKVHRAACPQCQDGTAQEILPKGAKGRTEWSKPFATAQEARGYMMKTFAKYKSLGLCPACKP